MAVLEEMVVVFSKCNPVSRIRQKPFEQYISPLATLSGLKGIALPSSSDVTLP
jgi:hypothetical protein